MARDDRAKQHRRYQSVDDYPALEPEGKPADLAPDLEEVGRGRRLLPPFIALGVVIVLVVGVALAGRAATVMSDLFEHPSAAPTPVPWLEVAGDPTPSPSPYDALPKNVEPCFVKSIPASQRWVEGEIWPVSVIVLTNNTKTNCYLVGTPTGVSLVYEDDLWVSAAEYGASTVVELAPNEKASFRIDFSDVCRTFARPVNLTFGASLRNTTIRMPPPPGYDTRCASYLPGAPGTMTVSGFEKWPSPRPPDLPQVRVDLVNFPGWVTPGERIFYSIDLTNMSGGPVSLYPCPSYRQYVLDKMVQPPVEYRLNCEAVGGRLEPGQTVRFDMAFDVPPETPPGAAVFRWEAVSGIAAQMRTPIAIQAPN